MEALTLGFVFRHTPFSALHSEESLQLDTHGRLEQQWTETTHMLTRCGPSRVPTRGGRITGSRFGGTWKVMWSDVCVAWSRPCEYLLSDEEGGTDLP